MKTIEIPSRAPMWIHTLVDWILSWFKGIEDMPPPNDAKTGDPRKEAVKKEEPKKEEPRNSSQRQEEECNEDQEKMLAKLLVYGLPIAIWIPWAYRMFKGPKCCPEPPLPKSRRYKKGRRGDDCGC